MGSPLGTDRQCPCGSGSGYSGCCGSLHNGEPADTAEALMRSRYAAYVVDRPDYVFRTWHPRTRPDDVSVSPELTWLGLEVLGVEGGGPGDEVGTVEFRARYRGPSGEEALHEVSRFERRRGHWVYVDGDWKQP